MLWIATANPTHTNLQEATDMSTIKTGLNKIISNKLIIGFILTIFAITAGVQSILKKSEFYPEVNKTYTHYNNYIIFKNSFTHLSEHKDLYQMYPEEHWDLYKYSPTFSFFMGIFSLFPDSIGLCLWNLLNALALFFAVYALPYLSPKQKGFALLLCVFELMTSMQNSQSNALMAGLLILSFALMEKNKFFLAVLCIVSSMYIKIFGIVGMSLFLFYPDKWKNALYSVFWIILLFLLPLFVIDFNQLLFLYKSWGHLLSNDYQSAYSLSVVGLINTWFHLDINKNLVLIPGIILFMIPFIFTKKYSESTFRTLALASVLIWIIIFNHKAESPTFIVAMIGICIWFFISKPDKINLSLFLFAFILTSLSATDLFPKIIRDTWVKPYALKALPCVIIWFKILYDMISLHT
ncbi:MAG TPA: glycosyltransferase family 87 protein, partial [Bacteroidia bacterium]|nr:glycosyltransferase family 87 protein [Bacteroidia bacterium]